MQEYFHILTLGCKVNQYESDALAAKLELAGFKPWPKSSDLLAKATKAVELENALGNNPKDLSLFCKIAIVHTCSVTGEAGRKSRQMLRRLRLKFPNALLVAWGCHVEMAEESLEADLLLGNADKAGTCERILEELNIKALDHITDDEPVKRLFSTLDPSEKPKYSEDGISLRRQESRAFLKIQDGCNAKCAYCAIRLARGKSRSREKETILEEARLLVANGFKELVITGIHLTDWGLDLESKPHLMELCQELDQIEGLERLRLGSLEPRKIDKRFISLASSVKSLCPHFHLSLQSGSEATLKAMRRSYSAKAFMRAVNQLKETFPNLTLTTDIIVGFPGETEEAHQESLKFCEDVGFMSFHVFRFSRRPGTDAANFSGQVNEGVKKERASDFESLRLKLWESYAASLLNKEETFLFEQVENTGTLHGYTRNYAPVSVAPSLFSISKPLVQGEVYKIRIVAYNSHALEAVLV